MAKAFGTPAAFKASLEERLRAHASRRNLPLHSVRLKLVMERLLARLFHEPDPPWILKGGYAMELRYRPRARTTRDLDLTVSRFVKDTSLTARLEQIRDELQESADRDLKDYLTYRIERAKAELQGAPAGGARFPCEAFLAGKTYGRFHIDIGFGDDAGADPEILTGEDLLGFAGVPPARALAIPKSQQFAEKLHAYTFPWKDRENTRTKDLVDMVLFIENGDVTPAALKPSVLETFRRRNTHALPAVLPPPPAAWEPEFAAMAQEANLRASTLAQAFETLGDFLRHAFPPS